MLINEYIKTHHKIIKADKVLLVTHLKPDGDAISSLCAMADLMEELKKDYTLFAKDIPPVQYHFLPYFDKIRSDYENLDFASYDLIIVLDCGQLDRTGLTEEINNKNEDQYVIEIDHHPKVYDYANLEIRFTEAAATAEILYYFFKTNNIKINKKTANCILTGILTDTGNLLYENTSKETVKIASEMLTRGAKFPLILENTSRNKSLSGMKVWGQIMSNLKLNKKYNFAYSALTYDEIKNSDASDEEMEGVAGFLSNLNGVKGLLFLREVKPGIIKGSLRSTYPKIDISKLAGHLGGGGHPRASGFTMQGKIVEEKEGWKIV